MSNSDIVKEIYAAYARRDLDAALEHCADDFTFTWPADPSQSHYSGCCNGKRKFADVLADLDGQVHFLDVQASDFVEQGERVAVRVSMHMRSKSGGRDVTSHNAHFWKFRDGQAVELVEYYDTALINSLA